MTTKIARGIAAALAAGVLSTLAAPYPVQAAGFSVPEVSTLGLGLANAVVANPQEKGAFAYNPSAMGFHDDSSVHAGLLFISPSFSVDTASGSWDSQGADWHTAPLIQAALKVHDRWRVGFGINAPFGLETRWQVGTFPLLSGTVTRNVPGVGALVLPSGSHPTSSKLEILDFVPSVAYRVGDNLSLALGLDIYWVRNAVLDSNLADMDGDGTGLGLNLSALYRYQDWSFGIVYRDGATVEVEGKYTPLNQSLLTLGRLQPAQDASVDLDLPWSLQLGVRYAVNEAVAVELDWTRTGWSRFGRLEIEGDGGNLIFADVNDWEDTNAYRIGTTWQVLPKTQLRFGYSYDETGQGDAHFSARVPDNDRQLFSVGIAQALGSGLSLEAGYMFVKANERKFRAGTPFIGSEINGTTALDGDYEMDAHLVGIELGYAF